MVLISVQDVLNLLFGAWLRRALLFLCNLRLNSIGSAVETYMRRSIEQDRQGQQRSENTAVLHNSFEELVDCADRCQICRVFRQSLILEKVTFEDIDALRKPSTGKVVVSLLKTLDISGQPRFSLKVELDRESKHIGLLNCSSNNDVEHLDLNSSGIGPSVIKQARGWLDECISAHAGQCDNLKWSGEKPALLVEILSPSSIRLCRNENKDYVALSYCWGSDQPLTGIEKAEVTRGETFKNNLSRRLQEFSIDDLPHTVRDALHIIYAMNIRYAWVDTLCIVQDDPKDVSTMHKIYSNALFTICACATARATQSLLAPREAWAMRTEPCRLGGQWLTAADMSLTKLRLNSPLAKRAWTLQEERLSPRLLYVSSSRIYWSCAAESHLELMSTYGDKPEALHRPKYAITDRNNELPRSQEFLEASFEGRRDLYPFWADIVKSYVKRNMSDPSDRFTALSGLAARYLSASKGDRYLAGLWSKHLAEGLAWKVNSAAGHDDKEMAPSMSSSWPTWSWSNLPLLTEIESPMQSDQAAAFNIVLDDSVNHVNLRKNTEDAIAQGEEATEIRLQSRMRAYWGTTSRLREWSTVSLIVNGAEKYSFSANPEQDVHAVDLSSGRILVYEDRQKEVIGQLDMRWDLRRIQLEQVDVMAFELGESTMLLLERRSDGRYRRLGVAWDVRENFFDGTEVGIVTLR